MERFCIPAVSCVAMETSQLVEEINALPQAARVAVERLVVLLNQQASAARKQLPVLYPADPAQEGMPFDDPSFFGAWSDRADITDGAEYIHQVRRGLRQP